MNDRERISLSNAAVEQCRSLLSNEEYGEALELINDHNEYGVGIELLIDVVCEENEKLTENQCTAILAALESMGLGASHRAEKVRRHATST